MPIHFMELHMKTVSLAMLAALVSGASIASPVVSRTELQKGYVCALSLASFGITRRGAEAALSFNLTSEPECKGTWLPINYACSSSPSAAINLGLCAKSASFSQSEQAMMQAQLLHAAERNLPVDVVRGNCRNVDSVDTCFVSTRILNVPQDIDEAALAE